MAKSTKKSVEREVMDLEGKALAKRFDLIKSRAAFAKQYGLNPTMIQQHLSSERPISLDYAKKYAEGFGCKLIDISKRLHDEIQKANVFIENELSGEYKFIDMMDLKLSAGNGNIVMSHDVKKQISFRTEFLKQSGCKPENAISFPVEGDSMRDVHILDGSIVLLNTAKRDPVRNKYYALWLDDKYLIKELVQKNSEWWAVSHNQNEKEKYPDIYIDNEYSGIIGQAFWCGFKL
ncbi:MAG TPA: S24 family peptidase [Methylotenera sp.]|nr:S24 family peptidase [Methylotenera sp.]